jgi:hypothetical protein
MIVPIAATARAITGLDVAAGGTITNVRLDGDLAVDWPRIVSDNIRIRSDRIDAKAIVLADVGNRASTPGRSKAGSTITGSTASASSTSTPTPM